MIRLEVLDNKVQHGIFYLTEPGRLEFSVVQGRLVIDAYQGVEIDIQQEPLGCYDGSIPSVSWSVRNAKIQCLVGG